MIYVSVLASKGTAIWNENLQSCRDTWCNTIREDDELHFTFGNSVANSYFGDTLIDPSNTEWFKQVQGQYCKDEVFYPVPDGYVSLATYKTLLNIRDFLETTHEFFVRTHTGSYLHLGVMHDICAALPSKNLYAGFCLREDSRCIDFASGSCFVISRDVAELVWEDCGSFLNELYHDPMKGSWSALMDDVLFGKIINGKHRISITPLPRICVVDSVIFDPKIAQYYMAGKSGKRREYYDIVHKKFLDLV